MSTVSTIELFITVISAISTLAMSSLESSSHHYLAGSTPPTLIACAGDQLVLTCTHDMVSNQASQWDFIPDYPGCTRRVVNHNNPDSVSPCGPFMFLNVTDVDESPTELSSTAVATANKTSNNTVIECYDSERDSANLVGSTKICVIGHTEIDGNISIINTTDVAEVYWDPFVYSDCAVNATVIYNVTVTTPGGEREGSVTLNGETSALISDLLPNKEYTVSVEASIVNGGTTCYIGKYQQVQIFIESDDPFLDEEGFSISFQLWIIIGAVCALGIAGIVITSLVIIAFCLKRRCRKSTRRISNQGGKNQNLNDRMKRITQQDNAMNYVDVKLSKQKGRKSTIKAPPEDDQVLYSSLMFTEKNLEASLARNSMLAEADTDIDVTDMNQQSFTAYI